MSKQDHSRLHILPIQVYLAVGAALLLMTLVTVAVSFVHLGPYNLVIAMVIATFKATLVALFFMHLFYDNKLYMIIFVSAIMFLGVFIMLTMFDTMERNDLYEEVAKPIKKEAIIYKNLKADSTAAARAGEKQH